MKTFVISIILALGATQALAAEFPVPQGGGKLPTIALVSCLAEEGSQAEGYYCRTTYECSPQRDGTLVSGTLWEGLLYHDGRRVTLESNAIAVQRNCVLNVEDNAKVSYFTGYRPGGRTGDVVAFTRAGTSIATNTIGSTTIPPDNMLGQFLSHHSVRVSSLEEWIADERICSSRSCRERPRETSTYSQGLYLEGIPATEQTACYIEARIVITSGFPNLWLSYLVSDWGAQDYASNSSYDPRCNG